MIPRIKFPLYVAVDKLNGGIGFSNNKQELVKRFAKCKSYAGIKLTADWNRGK